MSTSSSSYRGCDSDFFQNTIMAQSPTTPYQIPMLVSSGMNIIKVDFDMHDEQSRSVQFGSHINTTLGKLKQPCSTECATIRTQVTIERLQLRALAIEYTVDDIKTNPNYSPTEDINAVIPEVRDSSARQMERWAYVGYSNTEDLSNISGLRGLIDISTAYTGNTTLPIQTDDYKSICTFFVEGVNNARRGSLSQGYEFSKSDISVHVSADIVDTINCSILSNTTIGLWDQLINTTLSASKVVISDQITNSVFFVNNRRVIGKYNNILRQYGVQQEKFKQNYLMLLGTISFNPTTNYPPVVYANNVLDFS